MGKKHSFFTHLKKKKNPNLLFSLISTKFKSLALLNCFKPALFPVLNINKGDSQINFCKHIFFINIKYFIHLCELICSVFLMFYKCKSLQITIPELFVFGLPLIFCNALFSSWSPVMNKHKVFKQILVSTK